MKNEKTKWYVLIAVALIVGIIIGLMFTGATAGKADAVTGGCNCLGTPCVCNSGTTCDGPGDNNVTLYGTCIANPKKSSWWNIRLW